jgi:glucose/arabinose dehydrogenase
MKVIVRTLDPVMTVTSVCDLVALAEVVEAAEYVAVFAFVPDGGPRPRARAAKVWRTCAHSDRARAHVRASFRPGSLVDARDAHARWRPNTQAWHPSGMRAPSALRLSLAALPLALGACHRTAASTSTPVPIATTPAPAHHVVTEAELPPPDPQASGNNGPSLVERPASASLVVPPGFDVTTWASGGFQRPRWLTGATNGDVFLADADADAIVLLRDTAHAGVADQRFTFVSKLNKPFGMAIQGGFFYVGNTDGVVRWPYTPGQTALAGAGEKIATLPGKGYREHWTRNLAFSADGAKLYVTIGSQSNVDPEESPRASVLEIDPDGKNVRVFASGTRNPIGLVVHSATGKLWAAVQERDELGDDLVPDYVTELRPGGFYGWPYSYVGTHPDPRRKGEHPELVAQAIVPDVLVQAHSAVLGMVEVKGPMFPAEYRGDLLVACHGSWNRAKRTGYKLIRIPMQDGRPRGGYDDFVTGWMLGEDQKDVWGRPVGLLMLDDGSLLVVDDGTNKIWRVTYAPPR